MHHEPPDSFESSTLSDPQTPCLQEQPDLIPLSSGGVGSAREQARLEPLEIFLALGQQDQLIAWTKHDLFIRIEIVRPLMNQSDELEIIGLLQHR